MSSIVRVTNWLTNDSTSWQYTKLIIYIITNVVIATSLGPYFGRTVLKDQVEGEKHNKWLWEVSFVVALLLARVFNFTLCTLGM